MMLFLGAKFADQGPDLAILLPYMVLVEASVRLPEVMIFAPPLEEEVGAFYCASRWGKYWGNGIPSPRLLSYRRARSARRMAISTED